MKEYNKDDPTLPNRYKGTCPRRLNFDNINYYDNNVLNLECRHEADFYNKRNKKPSNAKIMYESAHAFHKPDLRSTSVPPLLVRLFKLLLD